MFVLTYIINLLLLLLPYKGPSAFWVYIRTSNYYMNTIIICYVLKPNKTLWACCYRKLIHNDNSLLSIQIKLY